jgi:hypothetical protein
MKRPIYVPVLAIAVILAVAAPMLAAPAVTVTGEIIDSACYIKMGARGDSHRGCAQACADAGIPLALLEDGTDKVIWLASKADMESPNADLREHAGRKVTITGEWAERGDARILVIDSIEPAM